MRRPSPPGQVERVCPTSRAAHEHGAATVKLRSSHDKQVTEQKVENQHSPPHSLFLVVSLQPEYTVVACQLLSQLLPCDAKTFRLLTTEMPTSSVKKVPFEWPAPKTSLCIPLCVGGVLCPEHICVCLISSFEFSMCCTFSGGHGERSKTHSAPSCL